LFFLLLVTYNFLKPNEGEVMPDKELKQDSNSRDFSKEDESKARKDELKDEDLRHISGGVITVAVCATCGNPVPNCTCSNIV
jgi:hypothetical protein